MTYDAIIVGGGHNGLVCAGYLARGGLRTLVLERRERAGGAADTVELLPGVRAPAVAHTVGRLRPSIVRDLLLRDHGLELLEAPVSVFAPRPDGPPIVLYADTERTAAALARVSPRDAEAYPRFDAHVRALAAALAPLLESTPPDVSRGPEEVPGRPSSPRGAGSRQTAAAAQLLPALSTPVSDFVAEWLEDDLLRSVVATRGCLYSSLGPAMAGSTALLLTDTAGTDGGAAGQTVLAVGGPGALSMALESAVRSLGVELRTGADVVAIRHRDGVVAGVMLASGEEVEAPIVVSGADPKHTLLGLLEPEALGPVQGWRVRNVRMGGVTAKVNLALRDLPSFVGVADVAEAELLTGRIVVTGGMPGLELAMRSAKYGQLPDEPLLEATMPSLLDPRLVRADDPGGVRHVMSIIVQSAPYHLRGGWAEAARERLLDLVLRRLESVAPGFARLVVAAAVLTPADLERQYGLTEGHATHGEMALDQWFAWRPLLGYGRYRVPGVSGLYLCGSGSHPGGGITGGPGQNAAREVLADVVPT